MTRDRIAALFFVLMIITGLLMISVAICGVLKPEGIELNQALRN